MHCHWRYRISYQFFSVYRVSFLSRFVVLAFEWRVSMRGGLQWSLRYRYGGEKRERSTGRKLFPDCRTRLSRRLDFRRFPVLKRTDGKCPEIFNAAENFISIHSLLRIQPRNSFGFIAAIILPRRWVNHSRASRIYFSKFHLPPRNVNLSQTSALLSEI